MKTLFGIGMFAFIIAGVWIWRGGAVIPSPMMPTGEYKNGTYLIAGQPVKLVNGRAEVAAAPGSASRVVTQYFGNEAIGDLNNDNVPDVAFLLTQSTGGSGTFYYVVAAIKTAGGYEGTSAVLLGDRIAPQTTEIRDGKLIVNYADRAIGESFAVRPSQGKSLVLKLDPATMQFGEVAQNFEGEADPARMTLGMQTWKWVQTLYNNDKVVTPKTAKFSITFQKDGNFLATTDCNGLGGTYVVKDSTITFNKVLSTMMYCAGSQEAEFKKMLEATQSYHFTSKGELIFGLKFDSGSFIFR